jgi:hypothetical protein
MALSARNHQPPVVDTLPKILDDIDHGSCDLARDLGTSTAYNQDAFRYFVAHERKRSERSNRPFFLLLVDFQHPTLNDRMQPAIASKLFAGLAACLRDTDLIGWYHEGRAAGAVLTHIDSLSTDVSGEIRRRVTDLLRSTLPPTIAPRLQVRVYQLPAVLPQ